MGIYPAGRKLHRGCEGFESFYDGEGFSDQMLVMAHFPQSVFSRFLQELRAARLVFPLKCVLTESNRGWNSLELHEQLCEERDAIARGASAHDPEGGGIA